VCSVSQWPNPRHVWAARGNWRPVCSSRF